MGLSAAGINREVSYTIESATRFIQQDKRSLSIPRLAILNLATEIPSIRGEGPKDIDQTKARKIHFLGRDDAVCNPSWMTIARGLLPSLRYVISEEKGWDDESRTTARLPDCYHPSPDDYGSIDPFGNDYYCVFCLRELANLYYSCDGCEQLLDREYKICAACLQAEKYVEGRIVGLDKEVEFSLIKWTPFRHHCVDIKKARGKNTKKCPKITCQNNNLCMDCGRLLHTKFTEHRRFHTEQRLVQSLKNCEKIVDEDRIPFSEETEKRLNKERMKIGDYINVPKPYYPDL